MRQVEPPARRKRLSSHRRAEVIKGAAARVFAARGYDRASMREIAREADVTTPVLYDHFKSKEELYAVVVEMQAAELVAQWVSGDAAPTEPVSMFQVATEAFFRAVGASDMTWRLLFADRPTSLEVAHVQEQVQRFATAAVAAQLQQLPGLDISLGIDADRQYLALAEAVKASGHALVAWWKDNQDVPIERVIELNKRLIWDGLSSMVNNADDGDRD
jgi:AcrR family transcriptional regulator